MTASFSNVFISSRNKSSTEEPEEAPSAPSTSAASGKLTGPGSHFRSAKESSGPGSNTTGMEPDTTGTAASTTAPEPSAAQYTSGPEAGGATSEQPAAAIGETSTYSSTPLASGDPTGSVVDPESSDPMTYQKPETSYGGDGNKSGVPPGAASVAATKAFSRSTSEGMPGSYPSQDEPTSASQLPAPGTDTSMAGSAATAATAGAGTGASQTAGDTTAPSTLTDTASPGDRSTEYGRAEQSKSMEAVDATEGKKSQSGMMGKVLGAVGLGSLGGAGAAAATSSGDRDAAVADMPDQPTTTTGVSSSTAPEQSGPPPSHHRKESIPTTAYPAGPESPRPVAPPVGGTAPQERAETTGTQDDHRSRDTALGAGAAGLGAGAVGAGAYAMHDRGEPKEAGDDSFGPSAIRTSDQTRTEPTSATATSRPEERTTTATEPYTTGTQPSTTATEPSTRAAETVKEDHTGRNVAAGTAAGVGAGVAGAYAGHEYSQHEADQEAARRATQHEHEQAAREAERQQQFEKEQKAREKEAADMEKQHQKEIEKKEKEQDKQEKAARKEEEHRQKEMEKEEKRREKEAAAAAKEPERQESMEMKRLEQEEEDRRRREKEVAGAGAVGAAGAGAGAYALSKDDESQPATESKEGATTGTGAEEYPFIESSKPSQYQSEGGLLPDEKKPNILKRLFKRKNKDTGEDEEYEEEGEDNSHHGAAAAAGAGTAGAAGAGAAYYASRDDDKPSTTIDTTDKSYEAQSGGAMKPSYNPFKKDDPSAATTMEQERTGEQVPYETGPTTGTTTSATERPVETTPATTAGTTATDPERTTDTTSRDYQHEEVPRDADLAAPGTGGRTASTTAEGKPIEPVTGLSYDPSKDPAAAKRIEDREHAGAGLMEDANKVKAEREAAGDDVTSEGSGHKKSLGERIKEKLVPGGHGVKEDDDKLKEAGYKHHSEMQH